ncbi:teichoic acid ABC transporter ATP-binding protein [Bacillus thuringiensis serovar muju]|nr:teichoic acids export ABC transporter ATP-binding subunit TagH [Bacillus thuringiensis]MBH0350446.1 teichoic acid ABC transporter ATP-binding protein [Bacillus thuringiensis]OTX99195.1 teichoic acid ABC transporter ATP-binding protein [Bacillus thuringiensis serovar muju]
MNYSMKFHNVTKKYKMHSKNSDKLKDILYPKGFGEDFYALRNLSFEAHKGDVIGIIGVNGSGKSTMSNLIAGITAPTAGTIETNGKVALIAIAAGLNNNLTGRENIELKCLMMGLRKSRIKTLIPEIIDFADIGKFIDMPVKKYSSGMKSRLGFAISVNINPDILVIDEALSVGDQTFADKCLKRMNEFKDQGKTIFFVSHSLGQVKQFCTKALWLEYGEIRDYGLIENVMPKYEQFIKEYRAMSKDEQHKFKEEAQKKQAGEQLKKENVKKSNIQLPRYINVNRNKKKRKLGFALVSMLLCMGIGSTVYLKKDSLFQSTQIKAVDKVEIKHKEKEKEAVKRLDIRYVKAAKARIRSIPSLDGLQVSTIDFGTPFIVKDQKKEELSGINWLSISYEDGSEGWISEEISSTISLSRTLQYDEILSQLNNLAKVNSNLELGISILEKKQPDIESLLGEPNYMEKIRGGTRNSYKNIDILYNQQLKVKEITIQNIRVPKTELLEKLGQVSLMSEDESIYMYHTDKYGFKFKTIDGIQFNQVTIFAYV